MKAIKKIIIPVLMGLSCLNTYSQSLEDWIFNSISGRWYLTQISGGWAGGHEAVPLSPADSSRIERIPGTDSVSWKQYHNCKLESETICLIAYRYDDMTNSEQWMIKKDGWYLLEYVFFPDKFGISMRAYDGVSYLYSKVDSIGLGKAPVITGVSNGDRCGPGKVVLGATANPGTLKWYSEPEGGNAVGEGGSFTTPSINNTTTYFVAASYDGCTTTPRMEVLAEVKPLPQITSVANDARCGSGSLELSATANTGTINWFDAITAEVPIATGSNFTTPVLESTTVYYINASLDGCATLERSSVMAIISVDDSCQSGIDNAPLINKFSISPNPADDWIELTINEPTSKSCQFELYNSLGNLLESKTIYPYKTKVNIDISKYPTGIYLIKCRTAHETFLRKIVKKR